jgi:hypothetical protein
MYRIAAGKGEHTFASDLALQGHRGVCYHTSASVAA